MSENWQVGDLALCVKRGRWTGKGAGPRSGAVCLVLGLEQHPRELYLILEGWPETDCFASSRFRKIKPLSKSEHEQFLMDLDEPLRERV